MRTFVLVVLALLALCAAADETEDEIPKTITKDIGLGIEICQPDGLVEIHVVPIPRTERRVEGWFNTTNTLLTLTNAAMSMIPSGLVKFEMRSICQGQTGETSVVYLDIVRPPPKVKVSRRLLSKGTNEPVPPLPPGLVPALPDGNDPFQGYSYKQHLWRLEQIQKGRRMHRSQ